MAQINLLPWREVQRQEKKKEFLTQLAGVGILALLVAFLWVNSVDGMIASQQARNNILQTEIKMLSKQVEEITELKKRRKELLDRMQVIQDLEGKRSIIVHYFDEFAKSIPDGVYITSMQRTGDVLVVEGVSESNNRVSAFMRRLDGSDWFDDPNLSSVVAMPDAGPQASEFSLKIKLVIPKLSEVKS